MPPDDEGDSEHGEEEDDDDLPALAYLLQGLGVPGTAEVGDPEKLANLLAPMSGWQQGEIRRTGVLARQQDLFSDNELLEVLQGVKGLSQVWYAGSARPSHAAGWAAFLTEVQTSLAGNEAWREILLRWLSGIAEEFPQGDVQVRIFNKCDLIGSLVQGRLVERDMFMPWMAAAVHHGGRRCRSLFGTLAWDGAPVPDLLERIRLVYPDPFAWYAQQALGEVWRSDLELLDLLGLRYVVLESNGTDGHGPTRFLVDQDERGRLVRVPGVQISEGAVGWEGKHPLIEFLQAHRGQIDDVVMYYLQPSLG